MDNFQDINDGRNFRVSNVAEFYNDVHVYGKLYADLVGTLDGNTTNNNFNAKPAGEPGQVQYNLDGERFAGSECLVISTNPCAIGIGTTIPKQRLNVNGTVLLDNDPYPTTVDSIQHSNYLIIVRLVVNILLRLVKQLVILN